MTPFFLQTQEIFYIWEKNLLGNFTVQPTKHSKNIRKVIYYILSKNANNCKASTFFLPVGS